MLQATWSCWRRPQALDRAPASGTCGSKEQGEQGLQGKTVGASALPHILGAAARVLVQPRPPFLGLLVLFSLEEESPAENDGFLAGGFPRPSPQGSGRP